VLLDLINENNKQITLYNQELIEAKNIATQNEQQLMEINNLYTQFRYEKEQIDKNFLLLKNHAFKLANEKDFFNNTLRERFREYKKNDYWEMINTNFQQLKDDSIIYNFKLKNYKLNLSCDLQKVPFLSYSVNNLEGDLLGIYVAISSMLPLFEGRIGIELVNEGNQIMVNNSISIKDVDINIPLYIPIPMQKLHKDHTYQIRVFGIALEMPVKIFEFSKVRLRKRTSAFMGFVFE
jgi:hypothetical protein